MSTLVALPSAMDHPRRHKKMLRDGSGEVWPDHAEVLFTKAIQEYDRQSASASANSPYPPDLPSRNEFIVRFLHDRGLERSKQQVASHIQQLKKRSSKELASTPTSSPQSASSPFPYHRPYSSGGMTSPTTDHFFPSHTNQMYAPPVTPLSANHHHHNHHHSSSHSSSSQNPVTSIAIRVGDTQPLQVPISSLTRSPSTPYSTGAGAATLTGMSQSSSGTGTSIRIRLVVPPHQDALSHLTTSRIHAIVSLNPNYTVQTTTLGNKISIDNMFLLEETDHFIVQGNHLYCPLRVSPDTGMMVSSQGAGTVTIQQTVYGGTSALLKITYELVHASQPSLTSANSMYQYPPNAGPFTQF